MQSPISEKRESQLSKDESAAQVNKEEIIERIISGKFNRSTKYLFVYMFVNLLFVYLFVNLLFACSFSYRHNFGDFKPPPR